MLQVMCLVENHQTTTQQCEELLEMNGKDLRKTINEIEFFVKSHNSRSLKGDFVNFYKKGHVNNSVESLKNLEILEYEMDIEDLMRRKNNDKLTDCLGEEIVEFLRSKGIKNEKKDVARKK